MLTIISAFIAGAPQLRRHLHDRFHAGPGRRRRDHLCPGPQQNDR